MKYRLKVVLLFVICITFGKVTWGINSNKNELLKILETKKGFEKFELDTFAGYLISGYLFEKDYKSAIIITRDSIRSFSVFKLRDSNWVEIYYQSNVPAFCAGEIRCYFNDFNFDGQLDVAMLGAVSNGTTIFSLSLWLVEKPETFRYIPEFEEIGTPRIDEENMIIQGFSACCAFTEISLSDYYWSENQLRIKKRIEVDRNANLEFQKGTESYFDQEGKITSIKHRKFSDKYIEKLIDSYKNLWRLRSDKL